MLSRVADALFWMSRYLERAEHVARLLDVCFFSSSTCTAVAPGSHELHWQNLAAILQQPLPSADERLASTRRSRSWLTFDLDNPAASCRAYRARGTTPAASAARSTRRCGAS